MMVHAQALRGAQFLSGPNGHRQRGAGRGPCSLLGRPSHLPLHLSRPYRLACRADSTAPSERSNGAPTESQPEGSSEVVGDDTSMDVRLECDESGCVIIASKDASLLERTNEEATGGVLQCNVTGCFYGPPPPAKDFNVLEGQGWRLGFETVPETEDSYSAMVGAGGWSIALTASEFNDFCKLIQMLRQGIMTMDQDGVLGRDDIVMQVEVGSMWMECVVPKKVLPNLQRFLKFGAGGTSSAFEIRFILTGQRDRRQAEGYWPADAVLDMLTKIDALTGLKATKASTEVAVAP